MSNERQNTVKFIAILYSSLIRITQVTDGGRYKHWQIHIIAVTVLNKVGRSNK